MRKNILWFVLALLSFIVLTIGLPNIILVIRGALYAGQPITALISPITIVAVIAFPALIISTVKVGRRMRWVLVAAALGWSGMLFGTINIDDATPNQYLLVNAVRISAALWLGYGVLFATQMLLTMQSAKPIDEQN